MLPGTLVKTTLPAKLTSAWKTTCATDLNVMSKMTAPVDLTAMDLASGEDATENGVVNGPLVKLVQLAKIAGAWRTTIPSNSVLLSMICVNLKVQNVSNICQMKTHSSLSR